MPTSDPRVAGPSRAAPQWLLLLAGALLLARVATGVWEARHAPAAVDLVAWVPIASAEADSRHRQRPILYDFSAAWCEPCQAMAADVFADERRAQSINQLVVPVRVVDRQREDGRNPPEVAALQRAYGIEAFPTLVMAWPGSARFEVQRGYRGGDATTRWIVQAAAMMRMRAMGALPDSATMPR